MPGTTLQQTQHNSIAHVYTRQEQAGRGVSQVLGHQMHKRRAAANSLP
jgi:hypothetical protein